jgi:hypothetical protein
MDKKTIEDLFWTGAEFGYLTTIGASLLAEGIKATNVWASMSGLVLIILGIAKGYRYRRLKKKLLSEQQ